MGFYANTGVVCVYIYVKTFHYYFKNVTFVVDMVYTGYYNTYRIYILMIQAELKFKHLYHNVMSTSEVYALHFDINKYIYGHFKSHSLEPP